MVVLRRQLESDTERAVVRDARDLFGVESIKLKIGQGWPDRLFFIPGGRPALIEFKLPGEPLRPLQEHRIVCLRQWGYEVVVYDDYDIAMRYLAERTFG